MHIAHILFTVANDPWRSKRSDFSSIGLSFFTLLSLCVIAILLLILLQIAVVVAVVGSARTPGVSGGGSGGIGRGGVSTGGKSPKAAPARRKRTTSHGARHKSLSSKLVGWEGHWNRCPTEWCCSKQLLFKTPLGGCGDKAPYIISIGSHSFLVSCWALNSLWWKSLE